MSDNPEATILGCIGEGIVLTLFRRSGRYAYHLGEGSGQPDIRAVDLEGEDAVIEVRYSSSGVLSFANLSEECIRRKALIIMVTDALEEGLFISRFPYRIHPDSYRLRKSDLEKDEAFNRRFGIDSSIYPLCRRLIAKYISLPKQPVPTAPRRIWHRKTETPGA